MPATETLNYMSVNLCLQICSVSARATKMSTLNIEMVWYH